MTYDIIIKTWCVVLCGSIILRCANSIRLRSVLSGVVPYFLDFLHVGRFLVAGDHHVDEGESSPNHQGNQEDIFLIEEGVKFQVVHLQSQDHIDLSVGGVGGEGTDAQLRDAHRADQHQNDVEQEAVHPGLVFLHGVEPAAAGHSDPELHCPLLHAPQHVDAKVREYAGRDEACPAVVEADQQFVHEGDQRPVEGFGDVAENSESKWGYIWRIQSREVTENMIPSTSLRMGTIGLVSANLSYRLNIQNYSQRAKYLTLNSVARFQTVLLPLHLLKNPPSSLRTFSSSTLLRSSPSLRSELMALTMLSLVRFIQSDFLALGRCLKWLIISMGRVMSPTPPNSTTKNHPKNDIIAITQTTKDASSSKVQLFSVVTMLLKSMAIEGSVQVSWKEAEFTLFMGSSTYLKKFQLMNSSRMVMTLARKVQSRPLPSRLKNPSSSSVQQKKIAKGRRIEMNSSTIKQTKYQKLFMSMPPRSMAELLATSRGTSKACAWQSVNPRITSTLQQRAVRKLLSSVWTQSTRRQTLMARRMKTKMTASAMRRALFMSLIYSIQMMCLNWQT